MTTFPAVNYLSNAARTEAEMKTAFEDFLAATKQLPSGNAISTLTLASDQITPTTGVHKIDTQAAAATDDLAQILQTNMPDGSLLWLAIVSSGRVVVLKHAAGGTGQLSLTTGADSTLGHQDTWVLFRRDGTLWAEVLRHFSSGDAASLRTYYGVVGVGQNTFTGRQEWKQGASLASGTSPLPIGTDGNSFHVTGTSTITALATTPAGTRLLLTFDGSLTLTHNATSLILSDWRDRSVMPGDSLELLSEGSGNYRQVGGSLAPDDPVPTALLHEDFFSHGAAALGAGTGTLLASVAWIIILDAVSFLSTTPRGVLHLTSTGSNATALIGPARSTGLGGSPGDVVPVASVAAKSVWTSRFAPVGTAANTGRIGLVNYNDGASILMASNPNEGVFFRFAYNTGNFIAVCRNAGSEAGSTVDTGIAVAAGTFHDFRIELGSTVKFYIDRVLKASIATNVPAVLMAAGLGAPGVNTTGWDLDAIDVRNSR